MRPDQQNIDTNGIRLRVAVAGQGPLVILIHGFPESWYSWRHQIPALADAGYRVAAPDVRGYGSSDKPLAIEGYSIKNMCVVVAGGGGGSLKVPGQHLRSTANRNLSDVLLTCLRTVAPEITEVGSAEMRSTTVVSEIMR